MNKPVVSRHKALKITSAKLNPVRVRRGSTATGAGASSPSQRPVCSGASANGAVTRTTLRSAARHRRRCDQRCPTGQRYQPRGPTTAVPAIFIERYRSPIDREHHRISRYAQITITDRRRSMALSRIKWSQNCHNSFASHPSPR